ncbi:xanthine dehydrogenase family protein molybdopterin-binding subunit [Pseudoduganella violaceinigra]|uniref:xanthine dehydrogenase family protein molybdopterin-binding subunit n=1 Tax=Pseudoduganella violaceinigra TaxID=246602 RepID=UPI00040B75DC|nr:xanthine dehydrogenase family protein molybdopterin-binding subunit [Pseudoduganella violaceinigra]
MLKPNKFSRRRFLLSGLAVAGAMVVGWGVMPPRQRVRGKAPLPLEGAAVALNGWIAIAPDGSVQLAMPRAEMGQGVHTALSMLVAEELDVGMDAIKLIQAPADKIYANLAVMRETLPFHPDDTGRSRALASWMLGKVAREMGIVITGGSSSVKDAWSAMREAGATARAMLVAQAAQEWKVAPEQVRAENGVLYHDISKQSVGYGAIAARAALGQPGKVTLKDPHSFRLIGTAVPRRDSRIKSEGAAMYGIDARPEGMVYAAVRMSPVVGGKIAGIMPAQVATMPGVLAVVDFSNVIEENYGAGAGVAVVARSYWQAKQAAAALPVRWDEGANAKLSSEAIYQSLSSALESTGGDNYHRRGDMALAAGALRTIKSVYRVPYLAHACMEPINCTAQVKDGKVTVWVGTQAPTFARNAAARVAGVGESDVVLHECLLGGGFGRRLEADMVAQAVAIAREAKGLPVQVIWTREDDTTHDVYRPAAMARMTAGLDAAGNVVSWDAKTAGGALTHQFTRRNLRMPGAGPDRSTAEGVYDMQYEIPNQQINHVVVDSAIPLGNWRSVGHSQNAFFKESFVDEMANAAGKDPVEFRRTMLLNHPRHLAVLNAAVAKAGKAPAGRAHGVALHQSFGTIVAQVAEVSLQDKQIRVHRVVCAIDCGIAVNPNIIAQQVESGVVYGLSAALGGEISIKDGKVVQSNFADYPVLRMNEVPQVETVIMLSAEPPEGVGEPATPAIAPAVANAVFALTGQRLRSLPLRLA